MSRTTVRPPQFCRTRGSSTTPTGDTKRRGTVMKLDAENYTPEEQVVAEAVEGFTFDELVTGEIPVHNTRVAATPKPPDPVPVETAVGFGEVPRITPRHMRLDRPLVALQAFVYLVVAAVLAEAALVVGFIAGLEAVGGTR